MSYRLREEELRRRVWKTVYPGDEIDMEPEYLARYQAIPQPKPIVLVLQSRYYVAENPCDLWGSKKRISHAELRRLIDRLTRQPWPFPLAVDARILTPGGKRRSQAAERANRREIAKEGIL